MRSLAFHLLRSDADADDATQETLARALAAPRRPDDTRPWLAGVLRNVVRRGSRDRTRRTARESRVARPKALPATADFVAREQILRRVADAVLTLDEPQRVVVLLRHYEGLPPREIAARLGAPVETVKSRLKRAHERLRETLDEGRRGNVEGWRSALGGLVGLAPDGTPLAGGTAGAPAGVGRGRAAGAGAKGGTVTASKTVVAAAVAAFVLGLGGVLVWKAPWRSGGERGVPTSASQETAVRVADDRAPALAAPPRPVERSAPGTGAPADAPAPRAPSSPSDGPAAGWKRWTVGSIQLDLPETWSTDLDRSATDGRSWSTHERPFADATFRLERAGAEIYAGLLKEADVVSTERIQIAGGAADLWIVEPKKGPPGMGLRALVVTISEPFGEGRPLSFFAASTREKFIALDPTYRAVLATVRATSPVPDVNKLPSLATLRFYEGETPADVLEGVVLLGDSPFPGGVVRTKRLKSGSEIRTALIGDDGRFRFDRFGPDAPGLVEVEPAGIAPRTLFVAELTTPAGARRRAIVVLGGASVEGHVFDDEGRAVIRALVQLIWNGRLPAIPYANIEVVVTTDRDGAYRADHLIPGRYGIRVMSEKGQTAENLVEVSGTTPIRFDLGSSSPMPTLSGMVRRAGGELAGPGSLMFMSGTGGTSSMVVATYDVDGRYSTRIPAGTYRVRVQPPLPAQSVLLDDSIVVVAGVQTRELALPSARVRGRLVDPATRHTVRREKDGHKPWQIWLRGEEHAAISADLATSVADDGTFQFEYVPPGRYTVVSTAPLAPGPDGKPRVIEVLGGGAITEVELELQAK